MIARHWSGSVPNEKARAYLDLMRDVAIPDYRRIEGNIAALCLHSANGPQVDVEMLTIWDDMEAIKAFAGEEPERAKYYDFDDDFLLSKNEFVEHWSIDACAFEPDKLIAATRARASSET